MTQNNSNDAPFGGETIAINLNETTVFEEITARMPTPGEREKLHMPAGVPVLAMRRRGDSQAVIFRGDLVKVSIDYIPAPDPDNYRRLTRGIIHQILEDLEGSMVDLRELASAIGASPVRVAWLSQCWQQRRAGELAAREAAGEPIAEVNDREE